MAGTSNPPTTLALALHDVTGDGVDLRPLSSAVWFTVSSGAAASHGQLSSSGDAISYSAFGSDFLHVVIDTAAVDAFEGAVDELQPIVDDLSVGRRGAMTAASLSEFQTGVQQLEQFINQFTGDYQQWTSSMSLHSADLQGKAASIIGTYLAATTADLRRWQDRLRASGAPLSAIIGDTATALTAFRVAVAGAWESVATAGLRGHIRQAIATEIADVVAHLTGQGVIAGTAGYQLEQLNPANHPGSTVTQPQYQAAAAAKIQSALASYPHGDLRARSTWDATNARITAAVSTMIDHLDTAAAEPRSTLGATYNRLGEALATWIGHPATTTTEHAQPATAGGTTGEGLSGSRTPTGASAGPRADAAAGGGLPAEYVSPIPTLTGSGSGAGRAAGPGTGTTVPAPTTDVAAGGSGAGGGVARGGPAAWALAPLAASRVSQNADATNHDAATAGAPAFLPLQPAETAPPGSPAALTAAGITRTDPPSVVGDPAFAAGDPGDGGSFPGLTAAVGVGPAGAGTARVTDAPGADGGTGTGDAGGLEDGWRPGGSAVGFTVTSHSVNAGHVDHRDRPADGLLFLPSNLSVGTVPRLPGAAALPPTPTLAAAMSGPTFPPMFGPRNRRSGGLERRTWLTADEAVWGAQLTAGDGVIGRSSAAAPPNVPVNDPATVGPETGAVIGRPAPAHAMPRSA